jgi:hypothetical protein
VGVTSKNEANIMTTKTLIKSDLAQFTGSERWYRHGINRNVLYTDGAQHVAEHGGAYWLLDEIATIQSSDKAVADEEFQVWKLTVHPDRSATLTCDDGNGNIVFTKKIEYADCPLDENHVVLRQQRHPLAERVLSHAKPARARV